MRWTAAFLLMFATKATAVTCTDVIFDNQSYSICTVDVATEDLRLFHRDADGNVLGSFGAIEAAHAGQMLVFAMNAGMYHEDRSAVGLYRENGQTASDIVTSDGPGNFGLLPNGVFCIGNGRADIFETRAYVAAQPVCNDASQSGPMLVIDGALHPRFIENGTSKHIRNGVGTSRDGKTAVFAISNEPVNFHSFGRLFRDHLELPNALYFDGKVSRLFAPQLNRADFGFQLGPIVGVLE